jgi:hypothetical protein
MNLNLFTVDHARETFNPRLMKIIDLVILWALSPTLKVDVLINTMAICKWVPLFLLGSFHFKFMTPFLFEHVHHIQ